MHVNMRQMSLRDLSMLLVQVARELQRREGGSQGAHASFRRGPGAPGPHGQGRPQGGGWSGGGERPPWNPAGSQGGGWKRGPRRDRPNRFNREAQPGAGGEDLPSDNAGNREGANEGRFGAH